MADFTGAFMGDPPLASCRAAHHQAVVSRGTVALAPPDVKTYRLGATGPTELGDEWLEQELGCGR